MLSNLLIDPTAMRSVAFKLRNNEYFERLRAESGDAELLNFSSGAARGTWAFNRYSGNYGAWRCPQTILIYSVLRHVPTTSQ